MFEFSEECTIYQALEAEEELGDGSAKEDAVSEGRGEVLVVGDPSKYLQFEVESVFVVPNFEVEI